jgi:hypothetical protein
MLIRDSFEASLLNAGLPNAPLPSGDDRNDYFPGWNVGSGLFGEGNPVNGTTQPGYGPNTRIRT